LHQEIWKSANGPIPPGHHIHHIDGNTGNNDIANLECIDADTHSDRHRDDPVDPRCAEALNENRHLATEWHRSDAGRKWHSDSARGNFRKRLHRFVCMCCGVESTKNCIQQPLFCSRKCKAKHRRDSGVDNVDRVCECGKVFAVNRYEQTRHCSGSCAGKARWASRRLQPQGQR
jgi:hypothetical protein